MNTATAADQGGRVYYHGFLAPHSGTFTEVKVRARSVNYVMGNAQVLIRAGLYSSNGSLINPEPNFKISEGSVIKTMGGSLVDDQIIDVQFDSSAEVVKGDIYFVAISWTPYGFFNSISLYGTEVGNTFQSSFVWQEGAVDLPPTSSANEAVDEAFWFVINGPE